MEQNTTIAQEFRIPCVDLRLSAILNRNGEFEWKFAETLPSKVLGKNKARNVWEMISSVYISALSVGMISSWIIISILYIFKSEISDMTLPASVFVFFQIYAAIAIVFYLLFVLDFRIVWIAVRNYQAIANIVLSVIVFIGLAAMWNFDERSLVGINIVLVTIFISITDALPPDLRNLIGIPVLILTEFVLFAGVVAVILDRFPLKTKPSINLGTFDNVATTNVTLSVYQLTVDSALALVFFLGRLIYHSISDRKKRFLQSTFVPIRVEFQRDDAIRSFFELHDLIRRVLLCFKRTDNRAISQHVLGSDIRTVVMIPVQEDEIVQILGENKLFRWSFEHTLGYMIFGVWSTRFIHSALGGDYGLYKVVVMITFLAVCAMIVVGHVAHFIDVKALFIASCCSLYAVDFAIFTLLFDYRVTRMLWRNVYYWAQVIVSILLSLSIAAMYNFDIRTMAIPLYIFLIALIGNIDAFHTTFRTIFAAPTAVLIVLAFSLAFVLLFLGRLPDQTSTTVNFGTFGGLAASEVKLNLTQFVLDLAAGQFILLVTILYYSVRYPNELIFIKAKITGVDDPTFIHFKFLGSLLTARRRISQIHLADLEVEQATQLQEQHHETVNPEFSTFSTMVNEDGDNKMKIDI